jgi:hypothetical protein
MLDHLISLLRQGLSIKEANKSEELINYPAGNFKHYIQKGIINGNVGYIRL